MNDKDIAKLAAKLTVSLATKDDIKRLERKIDYLDQKSNTILKFAEAVDETVEVINQKVKRIEFIPIIAHELKKPKC